VDGANIDERRLMATPVTEAPVLDLLKTMTKDSIEASTLDAKELMLVRIAALVAVDAPPASYLLNLGAASELGIDLDDVRGVFAAVAPIVGTRASSMRQAASSAHWESRTSSRSSRSTKSPRSKP